MAVSTSTQNINGRTRLITFIKAFIAITIIKAINAIFEIAFITVITSSFFIGFMIYRMGYILQYIMAFICIVLGTHT